MGRFVSWEQWAVLLGSFSPKAIGHFEKISNKVADKVFEDITSNDTKRLKGHIKLLINLHRVAYAICQAHEMPSSKIVSSHRYWGHFFIASEVDKQLLPKDYDLLKCPYEELSCLLKAAFLLVGESEDKSALKVESKRKKDEFDNLIKDRFLTPTLSV